MGRPRFWLAAMARPTLGHLDPEFIRMMDEVKALLKYAFQTQNEMTFAVSAPGSAGMECCFVNLVEPGDTVADMLARLGIQTELVMRVVAAGRPATKSHVLVDGETIILFTPVAGG